MERTVVTLAIVGHRWFRQQGHSQRTLASEEANGAPESTSVTGYKLEATSWRLQVVVKNYYDILHSKKEAHSCSGKT